MSNYEPIQGRTMILQVDADTGYSGESLDWGDGQTGQYRVYWSVPAESGYGGITGKDWPSDLQNIIYEMIDGLRNGTHTIQEINEAVYDYSGGRLFNQWDNYVEYYNSGTTHCITPA